MQTWSGMKFRKLGNIPIQLLKSLRLLCLCLPFHYLIGWSIERMCPLPHSVTEVQGATQVQPNSSPSAGPITLPACKENAG